MNTRSAPIVLAAVVTFLAACASGASPADPGGDYPSTALAVIPASYELHPGEQVQFAAQLGGGPAIEVTWSVEGGGGSVTSGGLFTAAETPGTYLVVATTRTDQLKSTAAVTVRAAPGPVWRQGTGGAYGGSYLSVTGGGAMPSWTGNVVTASCAGDGATDDSWCLQDAANAARDQGKPLVIPAKASFYRVTRPITIYGSVGGVNGTPTIRTTNTSATNAGSILRLAPTMTGWIYNLHLVGAFNGWNATGEWAHNIDVGSVTGVTIKDNLLENAMGDAVGTDWSAFDGGSSASVNVLVDGNTMRNPYRCAVALVKNQRNWLIVNNVIDKQVNFVSGIDLEPEAATVTNVEIAYNKFVMNNRQANPNRRADGKAVFAWQPAYSPNPGGNFYLHHNYGTFGTGFSGIDGSGWGYVFQASNVEGPNVP